MGETEGLPPPSRGLVKARNGGADGTRVEDSLEPVGGEGMGAFGNNDGRRKR